MIDPAALCVYCRRSAAAARSPELVVPEALGNRTWTPPVGTVCDPCNNRLGSTVDAPFVSSGFGAMRSMLGVPGKRGPSTLTLPRGTMLRLSDADGVRE